MTDNFEAAIAAFDAENAKDPNRATFGGNDYPKELLYAQQMSRWLDRFVPGASEALRLAARCQHIRRWEIPRATYPQGREGYLRWRTDLRNFHARIAGEILSGLGSDEGTVRRVQSLVKKERLKQDPEVQQLEDVVCLVFLENYFDAFSQQHDEAKIVDILRKTWRKMSPAGQKAALGLNLPERARALVDRALKPGDEPRK